MQNQPPARNTNVPKSKSKSKKSKRSRYRRRKRRRNLTSTTNPTSTATANTSNTANIPAAEAPSTAAISTAQTSPLTGAEIWRDAYENAVRWHLEHQNNYWRGAAESLQMANDVLRQQLEQNRISGLASTPVVYREKYEMDDERQSKKIVSVKREEIEVGGDKFDVEYLEFLRVTLKHRDDLRRERQAEAVRENAESLPAEESPPAGTAER